MQTLHIQLKERTYPIYIGEGLLFQIQLIESHLKQKHVAVITNTTVAPLYLDPLLTLLKQNGIKAFPIILPDGEVYKNQETLNLIYDALLKEKCERTVTLIALGGGCYRRHHWICCSDLSSRCAFYTNSYHTFIAGGFIGGWQDGYQPSNW